MYISKSSEENAERRTINEKERLGGLGPQDAFAIGGALGYSAAPTSLKKPAD